MSTTFQFLRSTLPALLLGGALCLPLCSQDAPEEARDLFLTVGKSLVVDSPRNLQRVSVANETYRGGGGGDATRDDPDRTGHRRYDPRPLAGRRRAHPVRPARETSHGQERGDPAATRQGIRTEDGQPERGRRERVRPRHGGGCLQRGARADHLRSSREGRGPAQRQSAPGGGPGPAEGALCGCGPGGQQGSWRQPVQFGRAEHGRRHDDGPILVGKSSGALGAALRRSSH